MLVIRPVRLDDLDALLELARQAGVGLTTLPVDPVLLRKRIVKSIRSFEDAPDEPGGECYLFVLEDTERKTPVGTCGISAKAGGFEPLYVYRIENAIHASSTLGVHKEVPVLHLLAEHSGPSEIGSLLLSPVYRKSGNGRLLSLSRFLFMAEHESSFDPTVIAEIRGHVEVGGHSPFWDALGKHFFEVDFPRADFLSSMNKKFIADLMPKHPIYVFLLPEDARQAIGKPHDESRPAMRMLESEGFRFANMVDIFDAGPVVTCPLKSIRTVRQSRRATVVGIEEFATVDDLMLISNTRGEFRVCLGGVVVDENRGGVIVGPQVASALNVSRQDVVRFVSLHGEH